jgi:ubiquinone/menaquinone biosynthesis C-methylase UbiE
VARCDDHQVSLYGRIFAASYDGMFARPERAGLSQKRARLVSRAHGRTVELGAGTGLNLRHYQRAGIELTLTEPEAPMAKRLGRRVRDERPGTTVIRASAEHLPFDDASCDSVVATLVLCTVSDQAAALAEIRRVLKPDGSLLFLEHVRSDQARVARLQDLLQPLWIHVGHGCHCNLDTLAGIRNAGFEVNELEHDQLPAAPAFVRPLIIGSATPTVT